MRVLSLLGCCVRPQLDSSAKHSLGAADTCRPCGHSTKVSETCTESARAHTAAKELPASGSSGSTLRQLLASTQVVCLLASSSSHATYKAIASDGRLVTICFMVGDNPKLLGVQAERSNLAPHQHVVQSLSSIAVLDVDDLELLTYLDSRQRADENLTLGLSDDKFGTVMRHHGDKSNHACLTFSRLDVPPAAPTPTLPASLMQGTAAVVCPPASSLGLGSSCGVCSSTAALTTATTTAAISTVAAAGTSAGFAASAVAKGRGSRGGGSTLLGSFSRSRLRLHGRQTDSFENVQQPAVTSTHGTGFVGGFGATHAGCRAQRTAANPSQQESLLPPAASQPGAVPRTHGSVTNVSSLLCISGGGLHGGGGGGLAFQPAVLSADATFDDSGGGTAAVIPGPSLAGGLGGGGGTGRGGGGGAARTSELCLADPASPAMPPCVSPHSILLSRDGLERSALSTTGATQIQIQIATPAASATAQNPRAHTVSSFLSGGTAPTLGIEEGDTASVPGGAPGVVMISDAALRTGSGLMPASAQLLWGPAGTAGDGSDLTAAAIGPQPPLSQRGGRFLALALDSGQASTAGLPYEAGVQRALQWLKSLGARPGKKLGILISEWCDAGSLQHNLQQLRRPSQRDNGYLSNGPSGHQAIGGSPAAADSTWLPWPASGAAADQACAASGTAAAVSPAGAAADTPEALASSSRPTLQPKRSVTLDAATLAALKDGSLTAAGGFASANSTIRSATASRGLASAAGWGATGTGMLSGAVGSATGAPGLGLGAAAAAAAPGLGAGPALVPKLRSGLWKALARRAAHLAVLRCGLQIAQGLAHIHASGYYHANLNPTTIFCSRAAALPLPSALRASSTNTAATLALAACVLPPLSPSEPASSGSSSTRGGPAVSDAACAAEAATALEVLVTAAPLGRLVCKISSSSLVPVMGKDPLPGPVQDGAAAATSSSSAVPDTGTPPTGTKPDSPAAAGGAEGRSADGAASPQPPAAAAATGAVASRSSQASNTDAAAWSHGRTTRSRLCLELSLNTAQWGALAYIAPEVVGSDPGRGDASGPGTASAGGTGAGEEQRGAGGAGGSGNGNLRGGGGCAGGEAADGGGNAVSPVVSSPGHHPSSPVVVMQLAPVPSPLAPGAQSASTAALPLAGLSDARGSSTVWKAEGETAKGPLGCDAPAQSQRVCTSTSGSSSTGGGCGGGDSSPSRIDPQGSFFAGPSANTFSFGMILHQLVTGRTPYYDLHPAQILVGKATGDLDRSLEWPDDCEEDVRRLGAACLGRDPEGRPRMQDAVEVLAAAVDRVSGELRRTLWNVPAAEAALFVSGKL